MRKVALITGASSGIGEACAHLFAKNNYSLILLARRKEKLAQVIAEIKNLYPVEIAAYFLDVRNKTAVKAAFDEIKNKGIFVDVLINNAGLALGLSHFFDGDTEHWDTMIDTNLKGLLYTSKFAANMMIEKKKGHIINIGSIAGKEVYDKGNVYCSTKHAVDAITRSMRLELAAYNIKVTSINPGAVETEFSIVRFGGDTERAKTVYQGFENLVAEDIAEAAIWVCNRPEHVNINDLTIMPTAQPMAGNIIRRNNNL